MRNIWDSHVETHGRVTLHENAELNIGYPYNPKKAEQILKDNDLLGYELKLYTTQDYAMDSLMMTEAPVVILFYDEVLRFVNKNVEGLGSNPTNMLNLKKVKIKEELRINN